VAVRDGQRLWHHTGEAVLTMRKLGEGFLEGYLAAGGSGAGVRGGLSARGAGRQLFTRIEGDYFTVLGLPLAAAARFPAPPGGAAHMSTYP